MVGRFRLGLLFAALSLSCAPDLDTSRMSIAGDLTFGEILYREACQRVAWTSQLDEGRAPLDVSNAVYGPVCREDAPPPDDAPLRLAALTQHKPPIVRVVDLVLPSDFLRPLQKFLEAIQVLADDATKDAPCTLEAAIASNADLLSRLMGDDAFLAALGRISGREGFRPAKTGSGLAHAVFSYPGIDALLDISLDLFLDDAGRAIPELNRLLDTLAHELRNAQPLKNPAEPTRTLRVALDLLYTPSRDAAPMGAPPRFIAQRDARGLAVPTPAPQTGAVPAPFVDRDLDKQADVDGHGRLLTVDGKLPALPFVPPAAKDAPGAARDASGRLMAGNQPAYLYRDLEGTLLAALLREQVSLADPSKDDLLGLLHGATALLGPRVSKAKAYKDGAGKILDSLAYQGFTVEGGALLELAHAYVQLLGAPRARDLLLAARTLLDKYEDPASRAVAAMLAINDRGKAFPNAKIPEASTFYDELIPIIVRVLSVPGLIEDLMDALQDPHVRGFGPMVAQQVQYVDHFVLDQQWQSVSGSYKTPVDRGKPDVGWNRSVMQRMLHLVHDANGVEFCNKQGAQVKVGPLPLLTYDKCKMFRIDDLGLFFALSIIDRSITDDPKRPETRNMASFREHITDGTMKTLVADSGTGDSFLQTLVGIEGFTRFPTPQAAARTLFLQPKYQSDFLRNASDPVRCSDGDTFIDVHGDSIFAWEAKLPNNPSGFANDSFYDAVRPLLNAFGKHDECLAADKNGVCMKRRNAAKIFLDLLAVLHEHWGSPQSAAVDPKGMPIAYQSQDRTKPRFSTGDNVVSYEAILGEAVGGSDLVPALLDFMPTLNTMTLDGTQGTARARPVLIDAMRYVFDPASAPAALTYRDGRIATTWNDGKTPVERASLYYILADAYATKRRQLAAATPDRAGSWRAATSDLVDIALGVEHPMGQGYRMKNRRLHGATLVLIDFLRARLDAHGVAGDAEDWVRKRLVADLAESLEGPLFAAAADLVAKLEADPSAIQQIYGLLGHLASEAAGGAFASALTNAGDLVQLLLDDGELLPIGQGVAKVLDPARLGDTLRLMKLARKRDPNKPGEGRHATLVTILANFFQDQPSGATPMSDLADVLAEVNRAVPGAGTDLADEDYRAILGQVHGFLTDEQRGFLKFLRIIQNRHAPPAAN